MNENDQTPRTIRGDEVRVGDEVERDLGFGAVVRGTVRHIGDSGHLRADEEGKGGFLGGTDHTYRLIHRPEPPKPPLPTEPMSMIASVVTRDGDTWPLAVRDSTLDEEDMPWVFFDGQGHSTLYGADHIVSWEPCVPESPAPRVIETVEELDALPEGSIVADRDGDPWRKLDGGWYCYGLRRSAMALASDSDSGPFTVLREGPGK